MRRAVFGLSLFDNALLEVIKACYFMATKLHTEVAIFTPNGTNFTQHIEKHVNISRGLKQISNSTCDSV